MKIRGLGKEPRAFSREAEKMTTVVHFSLIFLVITIAYKSNARILQMQVAWGLSCGAGTARPTE